MFPRGLCVLCGFFFVAAPVAALKPDVLRSAGAVPAHITGQFREPTGFQQSASGQYFVFDRRAHTVYGLDAQQSSAWEIVRIGGEAGHVIDPTAFASEPNGTFVVADAPNSRERIQIFTPAGVRLGGFLLPGRLKARVVRGRAAAGHTDGPHCGGRSRRAALDRVRRAVHLHLRSGRRQGPHGPVPRRRPGVAEQPVLRQERPHPRHAGALRVPVPLRA
jgi:hypothetical protein